MSRKMTHSDNLASHWTLLCFFWLLSKYVLTTGKDVNLHIINSQRHILRSWSEWTPWSACSRTCGGGVRMRTRLCKMRMVSYWTIPKPCLGETVEYELCERQSCSPYDDDFLAYQCSQRNGRYIAGRKIAEWLPYREGKNPCELQCWTKDLSFVYSFGKAMDGTRCIASDPNEPALCVNGRCMNIDCAGQLGIDNRRDICGICRGNNSTCIKYEYTFIRRPRSKTDYDDSKEPHYDYNEIAPIPKGATYIKIKENSQTNFIALVDNQGKYQINGNWRIQSPGRFDIHGSEFLYNRTWDGYETLTAKGPVRNDYYVYVLGTGDIPTVQYEFWISKMENSSEKLHTLNQIKSTDLNEVELHAKKEDISHNFIERKVLPNDKVLAQINKIHGYNSYYHRNEILKSVPSWSNKRHRGYKRIVPIYDTNYKNRSNFVPNHAKSKTRSERIDNNIPNERTKLTKISSPKTLASEITPLISTLHKFNNNWISVDDHGRPNVTSSASHLHHDFSIKERRPKLLSREKSLKIEAQNGPHRKQLRTIVEGNNEGRKRTKKKRKSINKYECSPCVKAKHQTANFCSSEFVLRAIVLSWEKQSQSIRYELKITQSYKNNMPILSREYIWTEDLCRCPKLRNGREYIIMGNSGTDPTRRESRLYLKRDSFVRRYTRKRARSMQRLVRDQHTICKP